MSTTKMRFFATSVGLLLIAGLVGAAPVEAAATCSGKAVTINLVAHPGTHSTSGNDVILGTDGGDSISGLAGDDTICGAGGNDILNGGSGNDVLLPGSGDDTVKGADGVDTVSYSDAPAGVDVDLSRHTGQITSGSGTDTLIDNLENLTASAFIDSLFGNAGPNTLKGGAGADYFLPHAGDDVIKGGAGGDEVDFFDSPKRLTIDLAVTTAQATGFGVKTFAGVENVRGSPFNDEISGSDAANRFVGNFGQDVLAGRGGSDELFGQGGADQLKGGAGSDLCDGGLDDGLTDTQTGCEELPNFP